MGLSYDELIRALKRKEYQPLYFLWGEEAYYIDRISEFIASHVLSEAEQSFNQSVLYGKECTAAQVSDLARRFPMMASHQVVIVREAQEMKDFGELIHYVNQPQQSTLLVLCYKYKKPDKRQKVFKALEKKAAFFESKKLYDNQVPAWITDFAGKKNYRIEPKAAALLAEFLGSDLGKIAQEIEKLTIAIGDPNQSISPALVEKHIGYSKDFNQFELQDALGSRNGTKAMRIVKHFASNEKKYPLALTLISLYYFFSKLLLFHYTADKSRQNLAAVLKVNPYFVKNYQSAARFYPASKLVRIISLLREYDMRSKGYEGSHVPEGELTRELVAKILYT